MGRADVLVDVGAVRLRGDHLDLGTQRAEDLAADGRAGSVRAVEHDAQTLEGTGGDGAEQVLDVGTGELGLYQELADALGRGTR